MHHTRIICDFVRLNLYHWQRRQGANSHSAVMAIIVEEKEIVMMLIW